MSAEQGNAGPRDALCVEHGTGQPCRLCQLERVGVEPGPPGGRTMTEVAADYLGVELWRIERAIGTTVEVPARFVTLVQRLSHALQAPIDEPGLLMGDWLDSVEAALLAGLARISFTSAQRAMVIAREREKAQAWGGLVVQVCTKLGVAPPEGVDDIERVRGAIVAEIDVLAELDAAQFAEGGA